MSIGVNVYMTITRSILASVILGFFYWVMVLLLTLLDESFYHLCRQIIIPSILGLAIGFFLNCSKKRMILVYSFISILVCHLISSTRVLILFYNDLHIQTHILQSIENFAVIGLIEIFISVLVCFITLKIRGKG